MDAADVREVFDTILPAEALTAAVQAADFQEREGKLDATRLTFRTSRRQYLLKYCPEFPDRFGSIQDAKNFCRSFFDWYNKIHRHSGIALIPPEKVHYDLAGQVIENRAAVLEKAFQKHPERFKGKLPKPNPLPEAVWINKPSNEMVRA